jgi:hypothetical protein
LKALGAALEGQLARKPRAPKATPGKSDPA